MYSDKLAFPLLFTAYVSILFACSSIKSIPENTFYLKAPFENLDTICSKDWWNRAANPIVEVKVPRREVIAFGIYTLSQNTLKLTAQLFPLYPDESRIVLLQLRDGSSWRTVSSSPVIEPGWTAHFKMEGWNSTSDISYRLRHGKNAFFEGTIRRNPVDKKVIGIAALSCNSNHDRGDRDSYIRNINYQDPDLVFFAGDQSYDHKEHTAAWLNFGLQFREIFRHRPCITIPDDHDIGQSNLWGENGKIAYLPGSADGGYNYDPDYVRMVERAQTWHLPDPVDPDTIGQGIGVYFTRMFWAGLDFAIIEDRKFKTGPAGKIPQQGPRPDHITDSGYDPKTIDLPGLELLGKRQLHFLDDWAKDKKYDSIKVVLSQTGFCGAAHLHGSKDNRLHADLDSNGWPQSGRNEALRQIQKAKAVHIAGDQHIATLVRHGISDFDDGPWAFVVPASVNDYYGRWWWPEDEKPGKNSIPPLLWTGQYLDGFDNKITMHAYANPESESEGAGYGYILFDKENKTVRFECWPRFSDIAGGNAKQFTGWPVTVHLKTQERM